jgi:hypothetical protein
MNKRILAVTMLILAIMTSSMVAFADTGWFDFALWEGHHESSDTVTKTNNKDYAIVSVTELGKDTYLFCRVRRASDAASATEGKYFTIAIAKTLDYNNNMGVYGTDYYLNGYDVPDNDSRRDYAAGNWTP